MDPLLCLLSPSPLPSLRIRSDSCTPCGAPHCSSADQGWRGGRPFCGRPAASYMRRPRAPTSSASMVDLWCALGPFPPPCIHPSDATACSADLLYFALIARRYGRRRGEGGRRPCLHLGRTFCALRGGHGRPQADRSWFFRLRPVCSPMHALLPRAHSTHGMPCMHARPLPNCTLALF
jgi:hypothetical protein